MVARRVKERAVHFLWSVPAFCTARPMGSPRNRTGRRASERGWGGPLLADTLLHMASAAKPAVLGVIGGSGVYEIDGLSGVRWERVDSPFGEASDELLFG